MKPRIDHFIMHGEIDDDMSYEFSKFYYKSLKNKTTHVILDINTHGGYLSNMNSICSIIDSPEIEWHGCVTGSAYSAGIFILRSCDIAYATERSDMMFHDDVISLCGSMESAAHELRHTRKISNIALQKFAEKTKKDFDWWFKSSYLTPNNEKLMTARQAFKLGVIDNIGLPSLSVHKKQKLISEVIQS